MIKRKHHPAQADSYDVYYTPAIVPILLQVVGSVLSANESADIGVQAQKEKNLEAQIANQKAAGELRQAEIDAGRFKREESSKQARQRALRAGSGVIVGTGTPLLVNKDIAAEIARNTALIQAGGDINAFRLNQEADLLRFKGANLAAAGSAKRTTGLIGAGVTALTSGSKIFNQLG